MKPVLIVEGKARKVVQVNYFEDTLTDVMFVKDNGDFKIQKIDETNIHTLVWEGRYSPVIESTRKRIESTEEIMNDLAIQYIESEAPFPMDIYKEYQVLKEFVEGLKAGLAIVVDMTDNKTLFSHHPEAVINVYESEVPSTE